MNTQKTTEKMNQAVCSGPLALALGAIVVAVMFARPSAAWAQSAEWTVYNTGNSGLPYNGVTALAIGAQGTVWIGTGRWWAHAGGGLAKFDGTNWTVYNTSNSKLPDNDHVSLSIDTEGSIWSGTEDGLSKFDGSIWTVYKTHNSGLLSNHAGAPAFDTEGNAWIATFPDGGLAKFDGTNWTVYHTGNSGLPNNFVTDVAIDAHGNVWASTFGSGVARFDGQNWTVYSTWNSDLPHNDVSFLDADSKGNVWAGTYGGGLAKFSGEDCIAYTSANSSLPDNWIWNLSVDPRGNVWAGTKAGLTRFDGTHWTVYHKDNSGLPDNNVYCIAFDAEGGIWVGTQDGGLAVFRPKPAVDFNGDGTVDIKDLLRLIQSWGQDDPMVDIAPPSGDGVVDVLDLELLMSYWGQPVDDPTLAAHWALDESAGAIAYDSAGVNDAFVIGEPVWQPECGKVGGAMAFDGIDDRLSVQHGVNPAHGALSVLVWIKGGTPGQVVFSQANGANWLRADPSQGCLMTELCAWGRSGSPLYSDTKIIDGNWHRVGFVWDGLYRALYVDDILVAEDTQQGLGSSLGGLNIGCGMNSAAGTFWSGLIDDIRIYSRAVSP